jgi:hypothetical protein
MRLNEIRSGAALERVTCHAWLQLLIPFRKSYPRAASPRLFPPLKLAVATP